MAKNKIYYIDGYHGGIHGHMPPGCWRDIIEALKSYPEWKISLDIEAESWDYLQERDSMAYMEIREMLKDQSVASRLEMVAGSYGQPYGWVIDGESNIRHIQMGIAAIRKHFPWLEIKTYAVQEPCWTSALPQILRSFQFERAVLKNPSTAWAGYSAGFDAEVLFWEGPDGSRIKTAPRYGCEELVKLWETESVNAEKPFIDKCIAAGIPHPAGMILQDLGWPAKPRLVDDGTAGGRASRAHVIYTTWREYFEHVANEPHQIWKVSQEDFHGALPWGEQLLAKMSCKIRQGEVMVLNAERLYALACVVCDFPVTSSHPVQLLQRESHVETRLSASLDLAWHHLLLAQHHDAWICAAMERGEENWAWEASAHIYAAEESAMRVTRASMAAISKYACGTWESDWEPLIISGDQEIVCVANLLARAEYRTAAVEVTSRPGVQSFRVYDGDRLLESQYKPTRLYDDGSKNAGILLFNVYFAGFGAKVIRIESSKENDVYVGDGSVHASAADDFAYLESDYYKITFDLGKGGTIASLYDKRRGTEVVRQDDDYRFNEYRGYFINEGIFLSSASQRAKAQLLSDGPIEAALEIYGRIGGVNFTQQVSIAKGDEKISINVVFHFPTHTYIGDPHEIHPSDSKEDGHRSYHDARYKLNAYFPTSFAQKRIYKDAAFDVCESKLENTHFQCWNEIKHNILVGWVDACDDEQGLTIMANHTTSYLHGDGFPLALTLAWGWDGGFWWGQRQLEGEMSMAYAIVPHTGDYRKGDIWHTYQKMIHQPIARRSAGCTVSSAVDETMSINPLELLTVGSPVELSAAYMDTDGRLLVRLFNPGASTVARITMEAFEDIIVEQIELDGRCISHLAPTFTDGRYAVQLQMPAFSIRTLRIWVDIRLPSEE